MKLTKEQIAEIQARAEKASAGPWTIATHKNPIGDTGDYEDVTEVSSGTEGLFEIWNGEDQEIDNLKFAAAARSDIPALLAHIAEVERERERDEAQAACAAKDEAINHMNGRRNIMANSFNQFAACQSAKDPEAAGAQTAANAFWKADDEFNVATHKALSPTIGKELMGELEGLRKVHASNQIESTKPKSKLLDRFLVQYNGGDGPDVWDREFTIDAESMMEALKSAEARAQEEGGVVNSISWSGLATFPQGVEQSLIPTEPTK